MRGAIFAASTFRMLGFHVRQLLRTPFFVQLAITAPISFILLRVLGALGAGADIPPFLWLYGAIAGCWASTTTAVGLIGYQRFQGTLQYLVLTRIPLGLVFGALTAAAAVLGLVGVPISWALDLAITGSVDVTTSSLLSLVLAVLACVVSAGLLSSLFVLSRRALAFEPIMLMPIWLLVGLVVPFVGLPAWLQPVALVHPLTSAVVVGQQTDLIAALQWAIGSLGVDAIWLVAAALCMRLAIRRAIVDGTLELA